MVRANLVSLIFGLLVFTATFITLFWIVPFVGGYSSTMLISSNSGLLSVIVSVILASILLGFWKPSITPFFSLLFNAILYLSQAYISIKYGFVEVRITFVEGVSEFKQFMTYFEYYVQNYSPIMIISLGMIILHITIKVKLASKKILV